MRNATIREKRCTHAVRTVLVWILLLLPITALSQTDGDTPETESPAIRQQVRLQLQERLRQRIEEDISLTAEERREMCDNLRAGAAAGLSQEDLETLFSRDEAPDRIRARTMLRIQKRVLRLTEEGLPGDVLLGKLREGRMKGAGDEALARALNRLEANVRTAHRVMSQLPGDGVRPDPDAVVERGLVRLLSLNLWRGLEESDLGHLRERAKRRARETACTTEDFAAAVEVATRLREVGVESGRATLLAGRALEEGLASGELREIGRMTVAAHRQGADVDALLSALEDGLERHEGLAEMARHMMRLGWSAPADMQRGSRQSSPSDATGNGPGDGHRGGQEGGGQGGGQGDGRGERRGGDEANGPRGQEGL